HGCHVTTNKDGDQTGVSFLARHKRNISRLHRSVSGFDHGHVSARFDQSKRFSSGHREGLPGSFRELWRGLGDFRKEKVGGLPVRLSSFAIMPVRRNASDLARISDRI